MRGDTCETSLQNPTSQRQPPANKRRACFMFRRLASITRVSRNLCYVMCSSEFDKDRENRITSATWLPPPTRLREPAKEHIILSGIRSSPNAEAETCSDDAADREIPYGEYPRPRRLFNKRVAAVILDRLVRKDRTCEMRGSFGPDSIQPIFNNNFVRDHFLARKSFMTSPKPVVCELL